MRLVSSVFPVQCQHTDLHLSVSSMYTHPHHTRNKLGLQCSMLEWQDRRLRKTMPSICLLVTVVLHNQQNKKMKKELGRETSSKQKKGNHDDHIPSVLPTAFQRARRTTCSLLCSSDFLSGGVMTFQFPRRRNLTLRLCAK